ncbi:hypothetical protein ABZZ53_002373 [Listeria monocytogenes]|uniref:hypothetical protein n=1 Tax=Listeria monocytogenes TaxID=1639 RepID=UPI000F10FC4D|nr:hypothetical protein [Listeria monocytogenes]EAC5508523.1 hypothetical protein [Listeria monocytogenes]EAC7103849.1 hypothetical protein [Listeria monocytogenes]EAD1219324.1 hypothetical protein [Listeria monocytogenes]EAE1482764.1 hypothetical protein [Listeria monocytogenes]EAE6829091.1 hypothetical protein [Listeria monocytogenes]
MGNGHSEFEHNTDIVNRLLGELDSTANNLIVESLSSESELPSDFMQVVLDAEKEFDEITAGLKEYQELFKSDITRIRKASEEIVSHENQIAYKMQEALESTMFGVKSKKSGRVNGK